MIFVRLMLLKKSPSRKYCDGLSVLSLCEVYLRGSFMTLFPIFKM